MKSQYPFSYRDIKSLPPKPQAKLIKALAYDFLKRKNKLGFFYDCYMIGHPTKTALSELESKGLKPLQVCLEDASEQAVKRSLRDFFYDRRISIAWELLPKQMQEELGHIDIAWLNLLDNVIGK